LQNKKFIVFTFLIVISCILFAIIFFSRRDVSPIEDVFITNLTSNSATIIWTTDTKTSGSVLVSDIYEFDPDSNSYAEYFDDRDIVEIDMDEYVVYEKVVKRFTHHVTIRNLLPETAYFFKIRNGNIIEDVEFFNNFVTLPVLPQIKEPSPVYGRVYDYSTKGAFPEGIVIFSRQNSEDVSQMMSVTLVDDGTYSFDIQNIQTADFSGMFPSSKEDTQVLNFIVADKDVQTETMPVLPGFDQPVPSIYIQNNDDTIVSSILNSVYAQTGVGRNNQILMNGGYGSGVQLNSTGNGITTPRATPKPQPTRRSEVEDELRRNEDSPAVRNDKCTNGSIYCDGSTLKTCKADKSGYNSAPCPHGCNSATSSCKPAPTFDPCTGLKDEALTLCKTGKIPIKTPTGNSCQGECIYGRSCETQGVKRASGSCQGNGYCCSSQRLVDNCKQGLNYCSGNDVMICKPDKSGYTPTVCKHGCNSGTKRCNPSPSDECKPSDYPSGKVHCEGLHSVTCKKDSFGRYVKNKSLDLLCADDIDQCEGGLCNPIFKSNLCDYGCDKSKGETCQKVDSEEKGARYQCKVKFGWSNKDECILGCNLKQKCEEIPGSEAGYTCVDSDIINFDDSSCDGNCGNEEICLKTDYGFICEKKENIGENDQCDPRTFQDYCNGVDYVYCSKWNIARWSNKILIDKGSEQCKLPIGQCDKGPSYCLSYTMEAVCKSDFSGYNTRTCPSGQHCINNGCEVKSAPVGLDSECNPISFEPHCRGYYYVSACIRDGNKFKYVYSSDQSAIARCSVTVDNLDACVVGDNNYKDECITKKGGNYRICEQVTDFAIGKGTWKTHPCKSASGSLISPPQPQNECIPGTLFEPFCLGNVHYSKCEFDSNTKTFKLIYRESVEECTKLYNNITVVESAPDVVPTVPPIPECTGAGWECRNGNRWDCKDGFFKKNPLNLKCSNESLCVVSTHLSKSITKCIGGINHECDYNRWVSLGTRCLPHPEYTGELCDNSHSGSWTHTITGFQNGKEIYKKGPLLGRCGESASSTGISETIERKVCEEEEDFQAGAINHRFITIRDQVRSEGSLQPGPCPPASSTTPPTVPPVCTQNETRCIDSNLEVCVKHEATGIYDWSRSVHLKCNENFSNCKPGISKDQCLRSRDMKSVNIWRCTGGKGGGTWYDTGINCDKSEYEIRCYGKWVRGECENNRRKVRCERENQTERNLVYEEDCQSCSSTAGDRQMCADYCKSINQSPNNPICKADTSCACQPLLGTACDGKWIAHGSCGGVNTSYREFCDNNPDLFRVIECSPASTPTPSPSNNQSTGQPESTTTNLDFGEGVVIQVPIQIGKKELVETIEKEYCEPLAYGNKITCVMGEKPVTGKPEILDPKWQVVCGSNKKLKFIPCANNVSCEITNDVNFEGSCGGNLTQSNSDGSVLALNSEGLGGRVFGASTEVQGSGVYTIKDSADLNLDISVREGDRVIFFFDTNENGVLDEDETLFTQEYLGLFDITIEKVADVISFNLIEGWNAISIPMVMQGENSSEISTADDLLKFINYRGIEVTGISAYRNGKFLIYSLRLDNDGNFISFGDNFNLIPGEGYFIRSWKSGNISLSGYKVEDSIPIKVNPGWNLVGISNSKISRFGGFDLINKMVAEGINASILSKWESGRYENIVLLEGQRYGHDFFVYPTRGYWIQSKDNDMKVYRPQ
jgi:hypothetical protein